jgi:hypothetical protein
VGLPTGLEIGGQRQQVVEPLAVVRRRVVVGRFAAEA